MPLCMREPGVQLHPKYLNVSGEQFFFRFPCRRLELRQMLASPSGLVEVPYTCRAEPACEPGDGLRPGEAVPFQGGGFAGSDPRCLDPFVALQGVPSLCGGQVKRCLEGWLQPVSRVKPLQLRGGFRIRAFLQIRIDEILDRMRELVPDEFSVLTRWILESCISRPQIPPDHAIPVSETRIDVRRHVQRMRIAWSNRLVLARYFQRFTFAPRRVIGVHEIVHRARDRKSVLV